MSLHKSGNLVQCTFSLNYDAKKAIDKFVGEVLHKSLASFFREAVVEKAETEFKKYGFGNGDPKADS